MTFEVGCFGTLALHVKKGDKVFALVLTSGDKGGNPKERQQETIEAAKLIGIQLSFGKFIDGEIRDDFKLVKSIEDFIAKHNIDVLYSPSIHDNHQDHRYLAYGVRTASRKVKEAYFFETTSTTNEFQPQLYVDISKTFELKKQAIGKHQTQKDKFYMDTKSVEIQSKFRGLKVGKHDTPYEAFEVVSIMR